MRPDSVRTVLRDILQACVDAYAVSGAPDVPSQAYIAHGQPGLLARGDELVVWSGGISATHPFPLPQLRAVKTTVVPSALITIQVMRDCWPIGHASAAVKATPSEDDFTAASENAALDAATLFSHVAQLATTGGLVPSLPTIKTAADIALSPMVPFGPLGTRVGWRWPMAVKLSVP